MENFKLWLEFEHADFSDSDMENEACNIHVELPNGKHYGINVWTYKFLETMRKLNEKNEENANGNFQISPDLFVKKLTRDCIEKTIAELLKQGKLEDLLN